MITAVTYSLIVSAIACYGIHWFTRFVVTFVMMMGWFYFYTPSFTGPFHGFVLSLTVAGMLNLLGTIVAKSCVESFDSWNSSDDDWKYSNAILRLAMGLLGACLVSVTVLIASSGFFRHESYQNMIGNVEEVAWQDELVEVADDITKIRVLSEDMAKIRGGRTLSQDELGASFHVGRVSAQKVEDRIVFAGALEFNSFFQWIAQKSIPGYVVVDAQDELAAAKDIVKQEIVYSPSAYFNKDLRRHLWLNGFASKNILEMNFEIDDQGKGWWICTISKPTICWGADKLEGVAIVEPTTGEISFYKMDEIPEWVDRVIPESVFNERVKWAGVYKNGYWPSLGIGNKRGLFNPSSEVWLTWNKEGKAQWCVSCINYGASDSSLASVYLMDTRTAQCTFFKLEGAPINDNAAQTKAEGMVSDLGWKAENPILYTVNGEPTWVMTLTMSQKGELGTYSNGEFAAVACVNYEKEIRTYKAEKKGAVAEYSNLLRQVIGGNDAGHVGEIFAEKTGVVTIINQIVTGGESYFVFKVDGENTIYQGKYVDEKELAFVKEGDKISFDSENGNVGSGVSVQHVVIVEE